MAKDPAFDDAQIKALVDYVASLGGGPAIPDVQVTGADPAQGRDLFITSCAACHGPGAGGDSVGGGFVAPPLLGQAPVIVGEAIRTGPGAMPVFGPGQISDEGLNDIAAYLVVPARRRRTRRSDAGWLGPGGRRLRGVVRRHGPAGARGTPDRAKEATVTPNERRIERIVALAFAVTMLTGVALLVVYAVGGQTQIEGVLLAVCLASLGIGIVIWAEYLMNTPISIEERHPFASSADDPALSEVLDEEAGFTRRRMLVGMLFGALAGLGAALAIPALSLGPAPGRELFTTSWAPGKRLVDIDGIAVRAADLAGREHHDGVPGGGPGSARAQTLLIRVPTGELRLDPDRLAGAPRRLRRLLEGVHARRLPGGPLPRRRAHLICPCHQSTFDVLDGATPIVRARPARAAAAAADRSWPTTARSSRSATFRSRSGRPSGTSPVRSTARTTRIADAAPGRRGARRRTAPGRTGPRPTELERARRLARRAHRHRRRRPGRRCARSSRITGRSCWARSRCSASSILFATGTYLTFFFTADTRPVTYAGPYAPLDGAEVSAAFDSVMRLSFEVRAGLLMRQVHHWTALVFLGAIAVHARRIFFTGAFRRPREINWLIGMGLLLLALGEGITGYSLPDDLLSGTGLRIIYSVILSIPFVGPWVASLFFGGEFPTPDLISRLFVFHVMLLPAPADRGHRRPPRAAVAAEAHPVPHGAGPRGQRGRAAASGRGRSSGRSGCSS